MVFWDLTADETEMEDECVSVSVVLHKGVCMWVGGHMFMNEPLSVSGMLSCSNRCNYLLYICCVSLEIKKESTGMILEILNLA